MSEAFRFRRYQHGKETVTADYGVRVDEQQDAAKAMRTRNARQAGATKKSKGKQKAAAEGATHQPNSYPTPRPTPVPNVAGSSTQTLGGNNASGPHVNFVIDPSLLDEESRPSGDPTNANDAGPQGTPKNILINERQMQYLHEVGYPPSLPVNGPNDGLPMYAVPASASSILDRVAIPDGGPTVHDTSTTTRPQTKRRVSPRKKSRTTDARTIEEGQKILMNDSKGTRKMTRRR